MGLSAAEVQRRLSTIVENRSECGRRRNIGQAYRGPDGDVAEGDCERHVAISANV